MQQTLLCFDVTRHKGEITILIYSAEAFPPHQTVCAQADRKYVCKTLFQMAIIFVTVLAVLFEVLAQPCHSLSVTNYGMKEVSMMRHGEKYATNRDCYAWEDVLPKYHGMTHIRGLNDKLGLFAFHVDVPVFVYLAVDSRYSYIHGKAFERTYEKVMLGGCHARTPFYFYRSRVSLGPGKVTIKFTASRMTSIFVRDARLVQAAAELKIVPLNAAVGDRSELSMVREGEKFSTNRDCYSMTNIPPRFYGLTHVRMVNDVKSFAFHINVPAIVYVAIDSRYSNILPSSFVKTGEKIVHAGCHAPVDFPVYMQKFDPGSVSVTLKERRMLAVFVEAMVDNTFKSGVY